MWYLPLLAIFSLAEGCSWLEAIREKQVKIELEGEGLHRNLHIKSHLASVNRFSECRLLYELTIPAGAYIDSDVVNATLPRHQVFSGHRFDVEAPHSRSTSHKVWILSKAQFRKSFVIAEHFKLPIHVRYHTAAETGSRTEVQFTSPTVSLDCPADYTPFKLESCRSRRYGVKSTSASWVLIEPLGKTTVTAQLPVGDRSQLQAVLTFTVGTILLGLCMIFTSKS